jgi:hypothetical protein
MTTSIDQLGTDHRIASPEALDDRAGETEMKARWPFVLAIGIYGVLSLVQNLPAWLHGPSHTLIAGGGGDPAQQVWFLAWTAHAITHFNNPLLSNWANVPTGLNLAGNTSMPFAGLIGTPITLLFGPITTFNVLSSLAFFTSATATLFAARRWTTWLPAAFVAGLIFGFSPFMVAHGLGHLFLYFAPAIPLLLIVLDETLVRQRWNWWLTGSALGILILAELGISLELLTDSVILGVVAAGILAVARRNELRAKAPYALKVLSLGILLALPISAWYFATFLFGPGHVKGPIHSINALSHLSIDVASLVAPTSNEAITFGVNTWSDPLIHLVTKGAYVGVLAESSAYIGIPLLVLLFGGLIAFWRRPAIRFFGVMAGICLVISMGAHLRVANHDTGIPLPFSIFSRLPLLNNLIAIRWTLFLWLFIAIVTAVILDLVHDQVSAHHLGRPVLVGTSIVAILGIVALIPMWPGNVRQMMTPTWFSTSGPSTIPEGSTLLTFPIGANNYSLPMMWQAEAGMRWKIPLGEGGKPTSHLGPAGQALMMCFNDPTLSEPPKELLTPALAEMRIWQVDTIVVTAQSTNNDACALKVLTTLTGRPPTRESDVFIWRNLNL